MTLYKFSEQLENRINKEMSQWTLRILKRNLILFYLKQFLKDTGSMLLNKFTLKRSLMTVKSKFSGRESLNKSQKYCRV